MEKLNIKRTRLLRLVGACTLALGVTTMADTAVAAIANTKHNLGASGTGSNHVNATGTQEICVFCHTPHGADTGAKAPLWNKRLATGATYTTYESIGSTTLDAKFANDGSGGGAIGSVSLACLTCHDGNQAMDNIINAPGSGGMAADGGGTNGRTGSTWDWVGPRVSTEGLLNAGAALLGSDLSNDHPIGIQYCGGGVTTTAATGATCVDKDFKTTELNSSGSGNGTVWWVNTSGGSSTSREKQDMILYTRAFTGGTTGPSVECASCHDVHSENATFLRISNASSAVCLACHTK